MLHSTWFVKVQLCSITSTFQIHSAWGMVIGIPSLSIVLIRHQMVLASRFLARFHVFILIGSYSNLLDCFYLSHWFQSILLNEINACVSFDDLRRSITNSCTFIQFGIDIINWTADLRLVHSYSRNTRYSNTKYDATSLHFSMFHTICSFKSLLVQQKVFLDPMKQTHSFPGLRREVHYVLFKLPMKS